MSFLLTAPNFLKHQQLAPLKYILFFLFLSIYGITSAQVTVGFQGGEPGDPWGYTSTGASALSISEATQSPNKVTGTTSLVVGGNTAGGNCFATGSGNGPSTPRTFTFNTLDITSSNASTRTLTFKWGNRFPSCNGTGWDSGENLVFRAYHDGVAQAPVTLATGNNNAQFSILTNTYTWSIPPCVNQFYFVVSVTTNRADELLFLDNVTVTAPQLNGSLNVSPISGNTSVCFGSVENYSVTPETGISYTWSGLPAGASFTTTNGTTASSTIGVNWGTTPPGTYTLTVTPSNSCGVTGTPQTISVTIFPSPAPLTISGPTSLCSGQTIQLTSSYASGNTWTPNGETTPIISVTAPGTYTVSVPGSCGTLTASHTVTLIPSTPASISADGPTTFCPGSSVTLTSGNATGNNWSTGETTPSITVTASGTYTLTVTDVCGTTTASQQVIILPTPTPVTISGPTSLCSGQTITLTSSASTGNNWTPTGETTQSISVTSPGTYTVSLPQVCGSATDSYTVTLNPSTPAVIAASGPTTFCPGDSVTLTSNNATGNSWSTGETSQAITVTTSGTYTLTVTDICGTTTASQQVTVLPAPTPVTISGPTSLCNGQSITLTSSASTGNNWSPNGETTPTISVTTGGIVTVSVPQTCGVATASHTITLNPLPNIQSVSTINSTCFGTNDGSLTIHSSDTGLEFSLDGGTNWQPSNTFTNLSPGTYTPQVRFASTGCSITLSPETLTEPSIPAASASNSGPYCEGTAVSLNGTTTSTGTITYNWTGPNGFTSTVQNPTDLPSTGTHTYQLIVSINGCQSAPVSTAVTVNPIPVASVSNTGPYCTGDPIQLSSTVIPGGTIAYFWSGPNGYLSSVQNPTDATQAGSYQLITSLNGCQSSPVSTTVVINPIPDALASYVAPFCNGNPLQLNGSTTSTGTVSYSWTGPTGYSSTTQNPSDANTAGTYTLVVTESGCSSAPSSVIVVSEIPAVSASNAGPYCEGTPIQLNGSTSGTDPITYSWTGPNGYSSALQNPTDATIGGIYTLTINVNNCVNTASTLVTVKANPLADFSSTSPCMNDSVVFSSLSSAPLPEIINSWHWDFNDGFTSSEENPKHVFASAGVHQVFLKVTTASNCIADVSKDIEVKAEVDANFYFSPTTISVLDPNIQFVNASSNATGYLWDFGSENAQSTESSPAFTYPAHPGSYSIKLIAYNDEGCRDSIIKLVRLEDELIHYIPNAFTPDGDEFNQVFKPVFTSGFDPQNYTFFIYNRWGELIFESHDAAIGWDGTYQGQMVPEGTYTWNIRVKQFYSDAFESFSGHLTLAR